MKYQLEKEKEKKKLSPSPHCPALLAGSDLNLVEEEVVTTTATATMGEEEYVEEEEAQDRLTKEEVVNCLCQINEENGLMIQVSQCVEVLVWNLCVCWWWWWWGGDDCCVHFVCV